MAETYDVQAIIKSLQEKEEMDPDRHDGCYELMRETIAAYGKINDFTILDYIDLNLVYLTTVGTWKQGVEGKKKSVNASHLKTEDKEFLCMLWDEIWEKAGRGEYTNNEKDAAGNTSIGMFGTGFFSFQNKTTDKHAQEFIKMCVDILPMSDDIQMYDRADKVLNVSFQGMRSASASMVLHCLKPYTFPVLNSNMGNKNIFEVLGVKLVKKDSIETYIDNCRKIKRFRDRNFLYKNYRIFDMAAWKVNNFLISHPVGRFDSWEIIDEKTARKTTDMSFFKYNGAALPRSIRWFFDAENMEIAERFGIVLVYDGLEYNARIQKSDSTADQTRIFWDAKLAERFEPFANDGKKHILEFHRVDENKYEVKFMESAVDRKVWLLTWNLDKWGWNDYKKDCQKTQNGEVIKDTWACMSTKPRIGDSIFN